MKRLNLFLLVFILGCSTSNEPNIVGKEIDYSDGDTVMKGYLAYDANKTGARPGVIVVHEWWGHNEYARKRARMLAELGYTALAVDMYGDGKQADHPDDANKFYMEVMSNMEMAKSRFLAALEVLRNHETTNPEKMAAIGYCFGGAVVLHMARLGVDLDGVVSFHGSYATEHPAEPGKVKAAVLVCHGADDQFVSADQIEEFKDEMNNAGVDFKFVSYEGAKHSFTNPDADTYAQRFKLPLAYNKEADEQSWAEAKAFLARVFAQ